MKRKAQTKRKSNVKCFWDNHYKYGPTEVQDIPAEEVYRNFTSTTHYNGENEEVFRYETATTTTVRKSTKGGKKKKVFFLATPRSKMTQASVTTNTPKTPVEPQQQHHETPEVHTSNKGMQLNTQQPHSTHDLQALGDANNCHPCNRKNTCSRWHLTSIHHPTTLPHQVKILPLLLQQQPDQQKNHSRIHQGLNENS